MNRSDKRVGIVGYWYATNYGSVATYYALNLVLKRMGFDSMLVDIPEKEKDPAGEDVFSRNFLKERCKITPSVRWSDVHTLNDYCDAFVVGSDQVWTKDAIRIARNMFFLNFADAKKKKVAYAPSFGTSKFEISPEEEKVVRNLLMQFDGISVREDTGKEILLKMFNISAERVLDPVFLIEPSDYHEIASASKVETDGKYILAYILDPTPDKEKAIFDLQTSLNIPVKVILDGRIGTFDKNLKKLEVYGEQVIPDVSEEDWVKLFDDSEYVITDSHHGLAMAIIFHKQVIAYANHKRGYTRFQSLMNLLSISDRLIENSKKVDELVDSKIDYTTVQTKLDSEIKRSIDWLESVMYFDTPKNNVAFGLDLKSACTGCSACECICPSDAISMKPNQDGFLNPHVDLHSCSNCGLCLEHCVALNPKHTNNPNPICFAVWADDKTRAVSSSGGMFTLAAEAIIKEEGCVFGAGYTEEFNVQHFAVDKVSDLDGMRGSKYIQSNINRSFVNAREQLDAGKQVLFTGMPCQIAGLYSYLGKDYDNLYTIDLLCHGITSYKVFSKYHKDVLKDKPFKSLYFKSKKPWGWIAGINATFTDGTHYSKIATEDPYFVAYIKGLSRNLPCETCPFCRLPRQGDLTIGDFWKIKNYDEKMDDNKGTSVVLINNEKGLDLFEKSSPNMKMREIVPINYAVAGNGIIKYPYKLHANRNKFFSDIDNEPFEDLVNASFLPLPIPKNMSVEMQELYHIAEFAFHKRNGRDVILWGDNAALRSILLKYFRIKVPFIVTSDRKNITGDWIKYIDAIKGNNSKYFVISYGRPYDTVSHNKFLSGFKYGEDCVYRIMQPIVLNDLDLSKKSYSDAYGNVIKGKGRIKQLILRGFNNKITIEDGVYGLEKLKLDLTANSRIHLEKGCRFTQDFVQINVQGYNGRAKIRIGQNCRFMKALLRLFVSPYESSITIGKNTTFGDNLRMHANSGKKIAIKEDCMVSSNVVFWSGDGHSIFDVNTGKNINSVYSEQKLRNNAIFVDEHVWLGDWSMLLHGTSIGSGSIVGAKALVKKEYPTNCSIGGNPSKLIREDVAWCYDMCAADIRCCGKYAKKTSRVKNPISGNNVLVVGGSQNNGKALVESLLENGNIVTVANRGRTQDNFGDSVLRITVDVSKKDEVDRAFKGREYDVVFNNLAYSSNQVRDLLSAVKCKRYIQLSSVFVYPEFHTNLVESEFDPFNSKFEWSNASGDYRKGKQNAECSVFQKFGHIPSVVVRLPYVAWDSRLNFYCKSVVEGKSMNVGDPNRQISYVNSSEVGKFLIWIAAQDFTGVVNLSSAGSVSIREILNYIEEKTGEKAIIDPNSENVSPHFDPSYSLDVSKVKNLGFDVSDLNQWFWNNLDLHIKEAIKK